MLLRHYPVVTLLKDNGEYKSTVSIGPDKIEGPLEETIVKEDLPIIKATILTHEQRMSEYLTVPRLQQHITIRVED